MSEIPDQPNQPQEVQAQIPVIFPYVEGNIPSYANVVLVNLSPPDGVIIDFGFFDPLSLREVQEQRQETNFTDQTKVEPIEAQSVNRVIINKLLAEQLIQQIQSAIGNVRSETT